MGMDQVGGSNGDIPYCIDFLFLLKNVVLSFGQNGNSDQYDYYIANKPISNNTSVKDL